MEEEDPHNLIEEVNSEKKDRAQRACDACQRRKVRCEGLVEGSKCIRCTHFSIACTFQTPRQKRGPISGYVRLLELRLQKLEGKLQQLNSGSGLIETASSGEPPRQETSEGPSNINIGHEGLAYTNSSVPNITGRDDELYVLTDSDDDGDLETFGVPRWLQEMDYPGPGGYQGKSSGIRFFKTVVELRNQYMSDRGEDVSSRIKEMQAQRRPDVWRTFPWEPAKIPTGNRAIPQEKIDFPEHDLFDQLIDNYFRQIDGMVPLLNEVLFKRQISERLHVVETGFATVALLVAAIGARLCSDPRVFSDPADTHSRGWRFFSQAQRLQKPLMAPVTLYDMQAVVLTVSFLHSSSAPESGWSLLGAGLRLAMDTGAHRRKSYGSKPTVYSEQWKRAFWVLVHLDRHISAKFGKQSAIRDEDFDLDTPIECDDEYWFASSSNATFKQPEGKPCFISGFIHHTNLLRIVDFAMRTIHGVNKSKLLIGPRHRERLVIDCDSALNAWRESLPEYLKWSCKSVPGKFYNQSAALEVLYYQTQITIHRPFITSHKATSVPFPSLAICINAARSTSKILRLHYEHVNLPYPWLMLPAFVSGVMLLLHIWRSKKDNPQIDLHDEMQNVYACMRTLKLCEKVWRVAGQQWDTLLILASSGSVSLIQEFPPSDRLSIPIWMDEDVIHMPPPELKSTHISQPTTAMGNYGHLLSSPVSLLPIEPEELVDVPFSTLLDAYVTSASSPILGSSATIFSSTSEPSFDASDSAAFTSELDWASYAAPPSNIHPAPDARQFPYDIIGVLGEEMCTQSPAPNEDTRSFWTFVPSNTEMASWNFYVDQVTGSS